MFAPKINHTAGDVSTSWFGNFKNAVKDHNAPLVDEITPKMGYGRDLATAALWGSKDAAKRWGTAGGAALGMGYGAFSDNGSVLGSGIGGAMLGGAAGFAKTAGGYMSKTAAGRSKRLDAISKRRDGTKRSESLIEGMKQDARGGDARQQRHIANRDIGY